MERVQIFIIAEGLKMALSGRESSLVQTFCEFCIHLDIAHPSVHMTHRFVIQGCPTLNIRREIELLHLETTHMPLTGLYSNNLQHLLKNWRVDCG